MGTPVEVVDVILDDLPLRPVQAQRLTGVRVNLHSRDMVKPRVFQPARLTAGSSADFQTGQLMHGISQGG
jgi:hypothetical protein